MRIAKETRTLAWQTLREKDCYGTYLLAQLLITAVVMFAVLPVVVGLLGVAVASALSVAEPETSLKCARDVLPYFRGLCADHPAVVACMFGISAVMVALCLYVCGFVEWGKGAMAIAAARRGLRVTHSLSGWGNGWKMAMLQLWRSTVVFILLLLFIAPGVRAAFSYSMSTFLQIDHPDWSAGQCMAESKRLMNGNRWRLFCLGFSFIGWWVLAMLAVQLLKPIGGFAMFFLEPYPSTAGALFYEELLDADLQRTHPEISAAAPPSGGTPAKEQESEEETEQERNQ